MGNLILSTEEDTSTWRWYVARTEPGREHQAIENLRGRRQYGYVGNNERFAPPKATQSWHTSRDLSVANSAMMRVYLPEVPKRRVAGRKMRATLTPMIQGYLFLHCVMTGGLMSRVRMTPGILEHRPFLGHEGRPFSVPAAAIEIIRRIECKLNDQPPAEFAAGQPVFVSPSGHPFGFDEFAGIVEDVAQLISKGRLKVAIQLFQRSVPFDVDIAHVRAA